VPLAAEAVSASQERARKMRLKNATDATERAVFQTAASAKIQDDTLSNFTAAMDMMLSAMNVMAKRGNPMSAKDAVEAGKFNSFGAS